MKEQFETWDPVMIWFTIELNWLKQKVSRVTEKMSTLLIVKNQSTRSRPLFPLPNHLVT